jgi:hypothetical protein
MENTDYGERAHRAIGGAGMHRLGALSKASGYSSGNARHRIYIFFLGFLHVFHPISGDRSPSGRPLGDLGPQIRGPHCHATVLGLGQSSAECCCAIWKASTAVCRKQMRNDVDSELEGAGDNAMGMCRGRNNMKSDNVMGSSLLDRLLLCTSGAATIIVGSIRLLYGAKEMDRVEAPLFERLDGGRVLDGRRGVEGREEEGSKGAMAERWQEGIKEGARGGGGGEAMLRWRAEGGGVFDEEGSVCGRGGERRGGVFEERNAVGKEGRRREGWGV